MPLLRYGELKLCAVACCVVVLLSTAANCAFPRADDLQRLQQPNAIQEAQDLLMNLMTIIYICIQEVIDDREEVEEIADTLCE